MNEKQTVAEQGGKQDIAGEAFAAHQNRGQRGWIEALLHRWPTALGIIVATLTFFGQEVNAEFISIVAAIVVLMAVIYLGAAASMVASVARSART